MRVLATLKAEHVPAVFPSPLAIRSCLTPRSSRLKYKNGYVTEDHTWDHKSFTGASTNTKGLTDAQVKAELTKTINAITAAGLPKPTLWRAPYDDVTAHQANIATSLGLRLVMSYGVPGTGNIVDSQDWSGVSTATIRAVHHPGLCRQQHHGEDRPGSTAAQRAYGLAHNGATADPNVVYFHGGAGREHSVVSRWSRLRAERDRGPAADRQVVERASPWRDRDCAAKRATRGALTVNGANTYGSG